MLVHLVVVAVALMTSLLVVQLAGAIVWGVQKAEVVVKVVVEQLIGVFVLKQLSAVKQHIALGAMLARPLGPIVESWM
jgi:hypothetical protein